MPPIVSVKAPVKAKAEITIDAVTGNVLSSKNAYQSLPVASISKLMTVWLVMEKIGSGKGSLKSKVKIKSKGVEKLSRHWQCGGYVLKRGQTYTVEQLLKLALIPSSNAASVQLGIWVSGSNKAFIKKMNKEAKKLDLTKSSFTSACGLNNADMKLFGLVVSGGKSGTNKMSAYDVATLSNMLITKYPAILKTSSTSAAKIKNKWIGSTNKLLTNADLKKKAKTYQIDGLKTGSTRRAGSCLTATGKPKGMHRIITVILNDPDKFEDAYTLFKNIYKKNPVVLSETPFPPKEPVKPVIPTEAAIAA
jgi:D-alanyl-D-alanine carboxypeptidase (penicillin-binding protein 5/6)